MISVTEISPTDELVITGEMQVGDKVPNRCCQGFDWEVTDIYPAKDPNNDSVWGQCDNPECNKYTGEFGKVDHFHGISHVSVGDLAEWIIENSRCRCGHLASEHAARGRRLSTPVSVDISSRNQNGTRTRQQQATV